MGEPISVVMEFERPTKRTFRFAEPAFLSGAPYKIGTLYVQKHLFDKQPKKVKVTVEVIE